MGSSGVDALQYPPAGRSQLDGQAGVGRGSAVAAPLVRPDAGIGICHPLGFSWVGGTAGRRVLSPDLLPQLQLDG